MSAINQFRQELIEFLSLAIMGSQSAFGRFGLAPELQQYTDQFLDLDPGQTTYMLRLSRVSSATIDSNRNRDLIDVEVQVFRMLAGDLDERLYIAGELYEQQRRLLVTASYFAMTRVTEIFTEPEIEGDGAVTRDGDLMQYTVTLQVHLNKNPA